MVCKILLIPFAASFILFNSHEAVTKLHHLAFLLVAVMLLLNSSTALAGGLLTIFYARV